MNGEEASPPWVLTDGGEPSLSEGGGEVDTGGAERRQVAAVAFGWSGRSRRMRRKKTPRALMWTGRQVWTAGGGVGESRGGHSVAAQSVNLWQAFFQRQAVHHMSRFSMPYTLRHFFPSPRDFRLREPVALGGEERTAMVWGRCSPKLCVRLCVGEAALPVKATGGDCQEMLKPLLWLGVKLAEEEEAEPSEPGLVEGMAMGAVAW